MVTGSGQGSLSQTDLTDVQARVAVQGEDRVDALHGPVGDGVVGAAGDDLLGCLEDRPHGDPALAQFVLVGGQGEHGTEQRRRVDVVAAGVTDTRVRRREVEAGALPDRQRVDVSAQGDAITRLLRTDVDHQPGPRERSHGKPGPGESLDDPLRRARLLPGEFRVGVQVAAEGVQLGGRRGDGRGQGRAEVVFSHRPTSVRRLSGSSGRLRYAAWLAHAFAPPNAAPSRPFPHRRRRGTRATRPAVRVPVRRVRP